MKIVFFGSSKLVLPIVSALQANYDLKLVVTTEQEDTAAVPKFCKQNSIPYLSVKTLKDETIISSITKLQIPIAILADFGLIIPQKLLISFPLGTINIHPSLLPKFRGPTPVQSAMLSGNMQTGVSIIKLDGQVDHGPLLGQVSEPIYPQEDAESLHIRLFEKGADLLLKVLPSYIEGTLTPTPQDDSMATFTKKLTRNSGYISPEEFQISNFKFQIQQMIRAFYPWPGVWTKTLLKGEEKRIKFLPSPRHSERSEESHQFLIHVQDKKPMTYKDFLNGYPEKRDWLEKIFKL